MNSAVGGDGWKLEHNVRDMTAADRIRLVRAGVSAQGARRREMMPRPQRPASSIITDAGNGIRVVVVVDENDALS